jgi:hypothetical protein
MDHIFCEGFSSGWTTAAPSGVAADPAAAAPTLLAAPVSATCTVHILVSVPDL